MVAVVGGILGEVLDQGLQGYFPQVERWADNVPGLLLIAEGYGEVSGPRRVIQLAQEQLALMLSLSRQTTNQIFKELEAQGLLRLTYGEIEILDLECLRQAAQG